MTFHHRTNWHVGFVANRKVQAILVIDHYQITVISSGQLHSTLADMGVIHAELPDALRCLVYQTTRISTTDKDAMTR